MYMHMYIFLLNLLENTESFLIMPLYPRSPSNEGVPAWSGTVQGAEGSLSDSSPQPNHESSKPLFTAVHLCDYRNLNCTLKKLPSIFVWMAHKLKQN